LRETFCIWSTPICSPTSSGGTAAPLLSSWLWQEAWESALHGVPKHYTLHFLMFWQCTTTVWRLMST
jgi:hypothetical protein